MGCHSEDTDSLSAARAAGGGRAWRSRAAAAAATPAEADSFLALRDECQQAKLRERAAKDKILQLAAQLMRTEETAKRILTRTDPSARGGCAQALLDAEREVCRLKAALTEAESALATARRQGADSKHQAGELKKRLDEALSSQRRLALQLGRAQAGGGAAAAAGRSLAALSANARRGAAGSPAAAAKPTCGKVALAAAEAEAEVEAAAAARRFAEQQEELVAARERCGRLEQQLRQLETLMHRRASELHTLQMRVAAGGGAEGGTCPASALPWGRGASGSPQPQRRSSDGSEGGDQSEVQWLRLKVLKGQSALDSLTNSNTRLLRDLERARAHIQELQWAAQEQAAGSAPWASTGQQPPRGRSADGLGSGGADGSAAATTVLQLRQELAAANHHAARLQIELDAATAKLEIYQAHHASQPPQSGLMAKQDSLPPSRTSPQKAGPRRHPSQAPQPRQQPRQQQEQCDVRVERVASWLRSHISQPSHSDAAVGSATSDATSKQREAPHLGSLPDRRNTCTENLAEHENLVELHLHGAELDAELALGPCQLSFLTVDFWCFESKLSALAEGCTPLYNTTLQFACPMAQSLLDLLASGSARVQLHCCRSGSGGGTADYDTIAAADIPLRSLLVPGGVQEYQQCTLRRPDGHTCGTLRYALAALKTMCCHPAASLLPAAAPPHSRSMAAGAASAGKPRRLVVKVLGCRDLRPAHGSMSPYVALLLPAAAGVEAGRQLVFETRRAASGGASPVFQEAAAFSVSGSAAAQGLTLDAVVFNDAAGGAAGDYAIIGAAHIAVQAAGGAGGGSGSGSGATLYPLLHPGSGRHAGALELAVGWE